MLHFNPNPKPSPPPSSPANLAPSPLHAAAAALAAAYSRASSAAPLPTNMALGFAIAGLGDAACQVAVEGRAAAELDARRVLNLSLVRAFVMAPFLHFYFPWLARLVPGTGAGAVARRVVADQVVGPPLSLPLVFGAAALLQGRPETAGARLKEQLLPTWASGVFYWPLVHSYNFRRVAVANQPLFAHVASVPWNMVLSYASTTDLIRHRPSRPLTLPSALPSSPGVDCDPHEPHPYRVQRSNIPLVSSGPVPEAPGALTAAGAAAAGAAAAVAAVSAPEPAPAAAREEGRARVPTQHRHPLLAGALTGAAEILCTYPFEYIKTQLQITSAASAAASGGGAPSFRGSLDCARQTLARFGPLGLYRGFASNFIGALGVAAGMPALFRVPH